MGSTIQPSPMGLVGFFPFSFFFLIFYLTVWVYFYSLIRTYEIRERRKCSENHLKVSNKYIPAALAEKKCQTPFYPYHPSSVYQIHSSVI